MDTDKISHWSKDSLTALRQWLVCLSQPKSNQHLNQRKRSTTSRHVYKEGKCNAISRQDGCFPHLGFIKYLSVYCLFRDRQVVGHYRCIWDINSSSILRKVYQKRVVASWQHKLFITFNSFENWPGSSMPVIMTSFGFWHASCVCSWYLISATSLALEVIMLNKKYTVTRCVRQ